MALCVLLYGGGYIAQFIYNRDVWEAAGGIIGGTVCEIPSLMPVACFSAVLRFPSGIYGCLVCIAVALIMVLMLRAGRNDGGGFDKDRNFSYSDRGTYGTAGYMTEDERKEVLDLASVRHCKGTILGALGNNIVALPEHTRLNRNVAVFGSAGTMKSRTFARNMALQSIRRGESLVITDSKSELYADLAEYAKRKGYTCRVYNLIDPNHSDSWACLHEIGGDETMAQVFADVVMKNTGDGEGDHFWSAGELNLLKALILYVDQCYPVESKTLGEVYKLLTLNDDTALAKLFGVLSYSHPARAPFAIFQKASESVRSGIIVGLGARLQLMQSPLVCNITSSPEIDLTLPGREKCIYFVVTSDQDSAFEFLVSLFFSFLFIKLVRFADRHGVNGKLPVPVHIIGDEWPNAAGTVPDFPKKISTIRSRNLSISVIFQNLAQMQNRYPNDQWLEILGNCDTQLFLGCSDPETAEFISKRTGEISVQVSSRSKMLNAWRATDYVPQYRETSSIGKRRLLTPDEVLRFPLDEALVILKAQKVLRVKKFDYTKHPDAKKLVKSNAYDHIPRWRMQPPAEPYEPCVPPMSSTSHPAVKSPDAALLIRRSTTKRKKKAAKETDPGQVSMEETMRHEEAVTQGVTSPLIQTGHDESDDGEVKNLTKDDIMA